MTRRGVFGFLVGGVASVLGGCGFIFPLDTFRQRIMVEIDTPSGIRSGYSVVETEVHKGKSWGDASGTQFRVRGEAVAVDLPGGRTLFALLRGAGEASGDPAAYQTRLISDALRAGATPSKAIAFEALSLMDTRAAAKDAELSLELPPTLYPMLVTFRDIDDPKSVERVNPADLAARFGTGVRLKRITVEVTDDEVTTGIEKWLRWLNHLDRYRSDSSNPFTSTLPNEIGGLRSN